MNRYLEGSLWLPSVVLALACGSAEPSDDVTNMNPGGMSPGMFPNGAGGSASNSPSQMTGNNPPPAGTGGTEGTGTVPLDNMNPGTGGNSGDSTSGTGGSGEMPAMGGTGGMPTLPTNELYVGENGVDTNPGTQAQPLATLNRAQVFAGPGFTIWVLPGTLRYSVTQLLSVSGAQGNEANLFAAPGARPVLEFAGQPRQDSGARGINLTGSFWHIRGLEIRNAGDNGMAISGSNNTIENLILHDNGDTGLQITAPEAQATDNSRAANNLILNCDSFANFDPVNNGENADGFAAKLRVGPGNVFRGCRAWNNADDGWDFFASDDVVTIEDSWAFLNGIIAGGGNSAGDGNGFKLGGAPNGVGQGHAPHVVRNGSAFGNRTCGFTINNNDETPVISNCGIGDNNDDYCGLDCDGDFDVAISGAQAIMRARNADGSLPSLR